MNAISDVDEQESTSPILRGIGSSEIWENWPETVYEREKKSINNVKHNLPAQIDGVENQVVDPVHTAYSCVSECSRVFLIELIFDCLARQYKCKVRWLNMNWKKNSQK